MSSQKKTQQAIAAINREFGKAELLSMVASGVSQREIARIMTERTGRPFTGYFVNKTLKRYGEDYEEAKRAKAQHHADKVADVAAQVEEGKLDPASARVSVDANRWLASRLDPFAFGEKVQAHITVSQLCTMHLDALKAHMATAVVRPELPSLPARDEEPPDE